MQTVRDDYKNRGILGMHTLGAAIGAFLFLMTLTSSASADIEQPEFPAQAGVPFHPKGTVQVLLPTECETLFVVDGEQHKGGAPGRAGYVRELDVYRLKCTHGDKRRTLVARGPWFDQFADLSVIDR